MHFHCNQDDCDSSSCTRGIQIVFLILIITGVALLIAQSFWVPKLVNFIMLHS